MTSEQVTEAWMMTGLKWAISLIASMWLAIDIDLRLLAILCVADVLVGLLNPAVSLWKTAKRLTGTFILVGTVHIVYSLAKAHTGLNLGFDLGSVVSGFYCLGEAIFILKGIDAMGIQIPPALLDLASKAEGLTGHDKQEIIALKLKQKQEDIALDLKQSQDNGKVEPGSK